MLETEAANATAAPLEGATVAVFVPTINESVDIVRRTVMAAQRMKQATEVWLLDDGNRLEMQVLADELGCRYLARTENSHAKAGNLNNALRHTQAEFIAIFDADHAPAHNFLEETLGFFRDDKVAFVQTPQDFYNLDSFQHRMDRQESAGLERTDPVLPRDPGRQGSAQRRVLLRQLRGDSPQGARRHWRLRDRHGHRGHPHVDQAAQARLEVGVLRALACVRACARQRDSVPQAAPALGAGRDAGLAPGRHRHSTRGLSVGQRVSYLATMLAYFEGWQRLIFFLAPVVVLTTGTMPILQLDREFLMRFVPYYVLTFWVFEEVARGYGRTLLTEQYNMMRFAVFITATFGFFLRQLRFVVTPKTMGERGRHAPHAVAAVPRARR